MKIKYSKLLIYTMLILVMMTNFTTAIRANNSGANTVMETIGLREGLVVTVEGYIVGEPISMNSILTENFRNNYAIAIADSRYETDINDMIFVKLDGNDRYNYGLQSNPHNINQAVRMTGRTNSYFGNSGLKYVQDIDIISHIERSIEEPVIEPTIDNPIDSTGYYSKAVGKSGAQLKSTLNDIIDNHTELSYSNVWLALRDVDEDPDNANNVILIYTGDSESKYDNGGGVDNWNREHVWAKSHGDFGTRMGAGTDLHHIRPADVTVNSSRGNKNFDESDYPHSEAIGSYHDSDSFEPRDEVKGDVARMIFYMATRYEGEHGEIDLEVVEYLNSTKSPYHGLLSTLLQWHKEDPVDVYEIARNNKIYENWQGNRNPYIDHPEWVEAIWN